MKYYYETTFACFVKEDEFARKFKAIINDLVLASTRAIVTMNMSPEKVYFKQYAFNYQKERIVSRLIDLNREYKEVGFFLSCFDKKDSAVRDDFLDETLEIAERYSHDLNSACFGVM